MIVLGLLNTGVWNHYIELTSLCVIAFHVESQCVFCYTRGCGHIFFLEFYKCLLQAEASSNYPVVSDSGSPIGSKLCHQ